MEMLKFFQDLIYALDKDEQNRTEQDEKVLSYVTDDFLDLDSDTRISIIIICDRYIQTCKETSALSLPLIIGKLINTIIECSKCLYLKEDCSSINCIYAIIETILKYEGE